ncbi:DUF4440 domain-containing protein [Franconibacter pulveris]|uniref:Cytoplasmic protein n=1 Tax=Franconibacter pulveris TaxID=435910 RepID=A0A0J8VVA1_9ENTR|nr:DUF4440 domain-containing protein [Franconibacter pulveris]KMV36415.1 cytoplasmic protein [Franconibacter pulveris]
MTPYFTEVLQAHVAIEAWLGKGDGDVNALIARFSPDYSMITLSGAVLNHDQLSQFFLAQRAAKPGLRIEVDEMRLLAEWPQGAAVSYRERQSLPGQPATTRRSTVIFTLKESQPLWRHLHETAEG